MYEDESNAVVLKQFTNKSQLHTLTVSGNTTWLSVENSNGSSNPNGGREQVRYKIVAVPLTASFGLAMYLTNFVLHSYSHDSATPQENPDKNEPVLELLFNALVSYVFSQEFPTPMKEEVFWMITRVARVANAAAVSLPWVRLLRLKEEMSNLQGLDKKRQALVPSYLQNLVELMTIAHEPLSHFVPEEEKKEEPPGKKDGNKLMDEDMSLAIAIATTLQNTLHNTEATEPAASVAPSSAPAPQAPSIPAVVPPPPGPAPPAPPAPPVSAAPALSTYSASPVASPAPAIPPVHELPAVSVPPEPVPQPPVANDFTGDDALFDGEMDDELAAAIAASMQSAPTESQEKQEGNKPIQEDAQLQDKPADKVEAKPEAKPEDKVDDKVEDKPDKLEDKRKDEPEDQSVEKDIKIEDNEEEEDYSDEGEDYDGASMEDDDFSAAIAASLRESGNPTGASTDSNAPMEEVDDDLSAALALSMQSNNPGEDDGGNESEDKDKASPVPETPTTPSADSSSQSFQFSPPPSFSGGQHAPSPPAMQRRTVRRR